MTKVLFFKSYIKPHVRSRNGLFFLVAGYSNKIINKVKQSTGIKDVRKAKNFALKVHNTQMYGSKPYSFHIHAVVSHLKPYGYKAEVAGYLHDVIEDTAITKEQISKIFGSEIANIVDLVTDKIGRTRKERKDETYNKMSKIHRGSKTETALIVKAADRLANMESCVADNNLKKLNMYIGEHDQFKSAAYRPGLCDGLWNKINHIVKNA